MTRGVEEDPVFKSTSMRCSPHPVCLQRGFDPHSVPEGIQGHLGQVPPFLLY